MTNCPLATRRFLFGLPAHRRIVYLYQRTTLRRELEQNANYLQTYMYRLSNTHAFCLLIAVTTYTNFNGCLGNENRAGTFRDYVRDTLGSVISLLNTTQTETERWEYWPYGVIAVRTGANPTPFDFVGTLGYAEGTVAMFYARARHLRTDLARCLYSSRPTDCGGLTGAASLACYRAYRKRICQLCTSRLDEMSCSHSV